MSRTKVLILLASVVIGGTAAAACEPVDSSSPSAVAHTPAPPKDPYRTSGEWRVPTDIVPGSYKAEVKEDALAGSGYVEICADIACTIGTSGFIDNTIVQGQAFISIPDNAVKIKLQDVALIPTN